MLPIQEIGEYYSNKYLDLKTKSGANSLNINVIENFMESADELKEEIAQHVKEEIQNFAMKAQNLIEIFTFQVYSLRDYISVLLSNEFDAFAQNIQFAKASSQKFLEYVNSLKNTPSFLDIEKQSTELASNQDLNLFAYNHNLKLNELFSVFNVPETDNIFKFDLKQNKTNEFTNRYNYARYLIRKVRETTINPPKNPLIQKMDYNLFQNKQQPNAFLIEVVKEMVKIETPSAFKIENSVQNISKNINYESFLSKSYNFKSFEIDTEDFFNHEIGSSLKCLHFYNPSERNLHLYNLPRICLNLKFPSHPQGSKLIFNNTLIKVPFPKEVQIPRTVKTISTPEGIIYFIGGQDSYQTLSFEYRPVANNPKKPKIPPPRNSQSSEERKESKQDSVEHLKRKHSSDFAPNSNSDLLAQAVINFKAKLNKSRYGHSLIHCDGSIYIIGGFESKKGDTCLLDCERYIIKEDKWVFISNCNYGVSEPSLFIFDNNYIYKYGGYMGCSGETSKKMERYCILANQWVDVPLISEAGVKIPILPKSSMLQINRQEIMVLGGQTETFLSSNSCYFLNPDNQGLKVIKEEDPNENAWDLQVPNSEGDPEEKKMIQNKRLPLDEGYVVHTLVHQGKLFCLAVKPTLDSVVETIFSYDGNEWNIL